MDVALSRRNLKPRLPDGGDSCDLQRKGVVQAGSSRGARTEEVRFRRVAARYEPRLTTVRSQACTDGWSLLRAPEYALSVSPRPDQVQNHLAPLSNVIRLNTNPKHASFSLTGKRRRRSPHDSKFNSQPAPRQLHGEHRQRSDQAGACSDRKTLRRLRLVRQRRLVSCFGL